MLDSSAADDNALMGTMSGSSDSFNESGAPVLDPLGSVTSQPISEAKLEEFCAPSELGKNWNACISSCEQWECCFNGRPCDKSKSQCGDHSICAQFFAKPVSFSEEYTSSTSTTEPPEDGPTYIQYTAVELAQACNSKQLSKDPSDCKRLCKGSACCFSSYSLGNCFETQKPFCHDHAICESVFDR